jgi:Na+/proline symporter
MMEVLPVVSSLANLPNSAYWLTLLVLGYFALLWLMANWSSNQSHSNSSFFTADRNANWFLVAFGMIGTSLSGVTFISIPGQVGTGSAFGYFQIALGYLVGYWIIAGVLLPLYYRLQLVSIYQFIGQRFGRQAYLTASLLFMLSRTLGATLRLYLTTYILHVFIFSQLGLPFVAVAVISLLLIWLYTHRGGIKSIVWTDTFQTAFMLLAMVFTIVFILQSLDLSPLGAWEALGEAKLNQIFFFEEGWTNPNNFFKQFLSGVFICISMTGLDQDMMQKNLSCRNLGEAQKNMLVFSGILLLVNFAFLVLGGLLWLYAQQLAPAAAEAAQGAGDRLYPRLAFEFFPVSIGLLFIIGLIAAAYSSADSSMTALTTSFCVDVLGMKVASPQAPKPQQANLLDDAEEPRLQRLNEEQNERLRRRVHQAFALVFFLCLLVFYYLDDASVINVLFRMASYTYGPLLGLFVFGLWSAHSVRDKAVPWIAIAAPGLSYVIQYYSPSFGYVFGFELLLLNALLTMLGLWLARLRA